MSGWWLAPKITRAKLMSTKELIAGSVLRGLDRSATIVALPAYRFWVETLRYKVANFFTSCLESNTILRQFCGTWIALDCVDAV